MNIKIVPRLSRNKEKLYYTVSWGMDAGQRIATGIFTFTHPINSLQRKHNKEALHFLEIKRSQLSLDRQAIGTAILPAHRLKANFLDFYEDFVRNNRQIGNRHLEGSLLHLKSFVKKKYLSPIAVTEEFAAQFRKYLLDRFNGDTPANYFFRFKKVLKAATRQGYFRFNPAEDLPAKGNRNKVRKDHLEAEEYLQLLKTPCLNEEVRESFIFCCYTGMRWCDIKLLKWRHIGKDGNTAIIFQEKTKGEHFITFHPIAKSIVDKRRVGEFFPVNAGHIFNLPTADGANKLLGQWCDSAGIKKHITWNCARLSFSVLLQDANVNAATVALLLGHTSTKYVNDTYKRYRPKDPSQELSKLPVPAVLPF
jgi:integrase